MNRRRTGREAITLSLKQYDEIFSDFDVRHFSERALSDDFLFEAKKASREKISGELELKFSIPKRKRNLKHEDIIIKRLKDHFHKHHLQIQNDISSTKKNGAIMTFFGIGMLVVAGYLSSLKSEKFIIHLTKTLLEPAGWFLSWTGMDNIIDQWKTLKNDLEFYKKMSQCDIEFISM
ncbi:MAG: hypothetical protein L6Q54_14515 [Leptospiraceae bacterium]|nr:hypothetical protein [Leptospiraceae bacterium]MCK6382446.1 hypothetical protein [Leptospiraceae bacterium]NUM41393.1 hypothetical protein [Leptospiraceae bacterium]